MKTVPRPAIAVVLCFTVVMLMPATSSAKVKTRSYSGSVSGGGTIKFKATTVAKKVRHKGHVKKTVRVTSILPAETVLDDVPITCTEGSTVLAWGFNGDPIKVKQRSFNPGFTGDGVTVFRGKFNKKANKATGTFRRQGDFPPTAHNCDTGTVHWSAGR